MAESWNFDRIVAEWTARGLNRRDLMKLIAGGASMTAMMTLLGTRPESAAAQAGETQASILWTKPVTLSPLFSTSGSEQQIERLMFGTVMKMSDQLVPTPDLAESVEVSPDATVYTFKLRSGITFTDGTPLTSKDVAFTIERALDPRTGSIWRGRLLGIAGAAEYNNQDGAAAGTPAAQAVSGLNTPDDLTVELTLSSPDAAFLPIFCNFAGLGILPSHILSEVAPDQLQAHPFSLAPDVTAGPYKFVRYETDQFLEVESNATYVGGAPAINRLFLRILTADVGMAQLETGELDLMSLPVGELERARGLANVVVTSVPSPSMDFFALNLERPYLQNKQVRQAMMYAIDREGIVASVLQGEGTVVNSPIFGPDWMGIPEGLNLYEYNPDTAKQLLDSSGFDKSQKLEIMHVPGEPAKDAAVVIIQEQLKQVGFNIEILQVDVTELNTRYIQSADFDIFYNAGGVFRADPNISSTYFLTRNFTPAGGNGSHYSNPQLDDLYAQGQAAGDQAERKRIYTEIAKVLNDELPWLFFWSPNSLYATSARLQGFAAPSYSNNKFWNAETWTVTG